MANPGGKITVRDLAEDAVFKFGDRIASTANKAIEANNNLIASFKELNTVANQYRGASNMSNVINNRQLEQSAIDRVIASLRTEQQTVADLRSQLERLNQTRSVSNQRTTEEIVNQRLLSQAALRSAQANSTFANSYQRLTAQMGIAATRVQDLIVRGRTAEQTQRQYNTELRNAQNEFNRLNVRVLQADSAVGRFNRNVGNYPGQAVKGLKDLIGAFGIIGGVTAFAMITKDIFNTSRELQSLDLALKNVTGTNIAFAESQTFLSRISEAYGVEINGLTKSYTGFLAASQNAIDAGKITASQIQDIFESVSKASGAMGLSVEQQQGAFLALQQMISKGNVQAEEIRGQLAERLPGAFGILAKSMGVTEQELNNLLKDGKVLAAEVLPAFAKELEKAYGVENLQRVESLAASTTRLSNAWTDFIREITEGDSVITKFFIGTISFIDKALKGFTDLTKSVEKLRDEQLETVQNNGYNAQLDLLKSMKDEEEKLGTATKDRLSLYAANETISSGRERLKELRDERNSINELLPKLQEQAKLERNLNDRLAIKDKYNEANERYNKSLDDTQLVLGQVRAATDFLNKENEKTIKTQIDPGKQKRQKQDIDYLKDVYELRKQNIENEIEGLQRVLSFESNTYEQRLEALNNYYFQKEQLNDLDYQEQVRLNNLNYKNQVEQYRRAIQDGRATFENLEELQYQHSIRKEKIDSDYQDKKARLAADFEIEQDQLFISDFEKQQKIRQREFENSMNQDLINENNRFAQEETTLQGREFAIEQHEKKILEIKRQYAIRAVQEQIRALETLLTNESLNADQRRDIEARLSDAKLSLSEKTAEVQDGINLETTEKAKQQLEELVNLASELAQSLTDFVNTLFDNRINKIDEEIEKNEEFYDKQIELAGDDASQKELLEAEAEKKRESLERKKREEQRKQAIFNKAFNAAQIIQQTSLAIISALAQVPKFDFGISASAIAAAYGAIGALQLANLLATPIPKYKGGRKGGKEEIAWVGDGGVSEVIESKSGNIRLTPNKATLTLLQEGDTVHKSKQDYFASQREKLAIGMSYENQKLNHAQTLISNSNNPDSHMVSEIRKEIKEGFKNAKVINQNNMPKIDINHEIWAMGNKKW